MIPLSRFRTLGLVAALNLAAPALAAAAVLETDLPPPPANTEVWPWLIAGAVVVLLGGSALKLFKSGPEERRAVDSFEAWAKTENELAPRAHTAARLPSRDTATLPSPPPPRRETAPLAKSVAAGQSFGRRSA